MRALLDREKNGEFAGWSRVLAIVMAIALWPMAAPADRGALTLEGGWTMRYGNIAPSIGEGDSSAGFLMGASFGARYAVTNRIELHARGFWLARATFVQQPVSVGSGTQVLSGALTQDISRWGGAAGLQYIVAGMVWRVPVGIEAGWVHSSVRNLDLLDTSDPQGARSYGLALGDGSSDRLFVAPLFGLEWQATDSLSFSIVPRIEIPIGSRSAVGLIVPVVVGWSWYIGL